MTRSWSQLFTVLTSWLAPARPQPEPGARTEAGASSLESLLVMSQTMTALRDLDEMLGFLLGEIQAQFGVSAAVLMPGDDRCFRVRSHRGCSGNFVARFEVSVGDGPVGECFSFNRSLVFGGEELRAFEPLSSIVQAEKWKSVLLAPLAVQNQAFGVFLAGSERQGFFPEKTAEALQPFVQIVALGIRNARVLERMEKFNRRLEAEVLSTTEELTRTNNRLIHRVRELKALYEITLSAGMSASLEEIFKSVITRLQELFDLEHVGFFINASSKDNYVDLVSQNPSFGLPKEVHPQLRITSDNFVRGGVTTKMILEAYSSGEAKMFRGQPVTLGKELPPETDQQWREWMEKIAFNSVVVVPLKTSQRTLGAMVLMNPLKGQAAPLQGSGAYAPVLSDEELRTLALIASRIASSIENFQLDMEIKKRLADLSTLQEISETFYAAPILEFDLSKIVKIILKSLACDSCVFMFFDPSSAGLVSHSDPGEGAEPVVISAADEKNIALQVFRAGKSRLLDDVQLESLSGPMGSERGMRSMIFIPLKIENEVIGVLKLGSRDKAFFNQHDLRLGELIADRTAVLVQNARLYEKIWHANKELQRLNNVKTEFVSMVSHELRTPMTAIKGFVDIVLSEEAGPLNDQQKKFMKIAHNSIDRLTLLISDLLDISRIEAGKMKMDLHQAQMDKVLLDSVETYRATIESKGIAFTLEADKKLPEILADEARVKQVIDNLLSNAMKFTPSGGQIKITADDMGDYVLIAVSDTGSGIRKEDQEKIFDRFYQVDSSLTRQVGGSGLGLAISKSIIEMHGGRIWVESEPGKGSTFRFLLPRLRRQLFEEDRTGGGA